MTKRKTKITTIPLTEPHKGESLLLNFKLPTVENILETNAEEMETFRGHLAHQQLELLDRRGFLANAIKRIDEHLAIINETLRMIEANQR